MRRVKHNEEVLRNLGLEAVKEILKGKGWEADVC
jgi:hypothetical protein